MQNNAQHKKHYLIVGLGLTGLSCARFCQKNNLKFSLCDTRKEIINISEIEKEFSQENIQLGNMTTEFICQFDELLVSPGVNTNTPEFNQAKQSGVIISGDIQLFSEYAKKPIVAITGSNGKSTVTTLVNQLINAAGFRSVAGGNLGVPALELLDSESDVDFYVLELSSFQLETTANLSAKVATILNISPDHMDRYDSMADYERAKQRVFQRAENAVVNLNDDHTWPVLDVPSHTQKFGLSTPVDAGSFGLLEVDESSWLAQGDQPLVACASLKMRGLHNMANALAALAIVDALGIEVQTCLSALQEFAGLPHRCQWVSSLDGVEFFNDSKGTNVGSTLAAIKGLSGEVKGTLWLLMGGETKGQSFSELAAELQKMTNITVLVYGAGKGEIADSISQAVQVLSFESMDEALTKAYALANESDVVLLSPACASFDQFDNYVQRGEHFCKLVEGLQ